MQYVQGCKSRFCKRIRRSTHLSPSFSIPIFEYLSSVIAFSCDPSIFCDSACDEKRHNDGSRSKNSDTCAGSHVETSRGSSVVQLFLNISTACSTSSRSPRRGKPSINRRESLSPNISAPLSPQKRWQKHTEERTVSGCSTGAATQNRSPVSIETQ